MSSPTISSAPPALVIDTSAVMCILLGEPGSEAALEAFATAPVRWMSAATLVELGIVASAKRGDSGRSEVAAFSDRCEIAPLDERLAAVALEGWKAYGKGRHPAALNLGDCFTYALAKQMGLQILCVGNDFPNTDVPTVDLQTIGHPQ